MDYNARQQKRIDYFRRSVQLDNPNTMNDPAYQYTDEELWEILDFSAPIHKGNTIEETPDNEFYFVLLLAKREMYMRLSTVTAPFYPLSAEGAELKKNIRFDHYIKLVETVTDEYDKLYDNKYGKDAEDTTGTGGVVTVYNVKLQGRTYENRYNQLSENPIIKLEASSVTTNSVNLDWNKYESTHGADFKKYEIFVSEDLIYDEYSPTPNKISIKPIFSTNDIRRTKIRVGDLEPDKEYYILAKVTSNYGYFGFSQIQIKTESGKDESNDKEIPLSNGRD